MSFRKKIASVMINALTVMTLIGGFSTKDVFAAVAYGEHSLNVMHNDDGKGYFYVKISDKSTGGVTATYKVTVKLANLASHTVSGKTVECTDTNGGTKVDSPSVKVECTSGTNKYQLKYTGKSPKLTLNSSDHYSDMKFSFDYTRPKCTTATTSVSSNASGVKAEFTTAPKTSVVSHTVSTTDSIVLTMNLRNANMYRNSNADNYNHAYFNITLNNSPETYTVTYKSSGVNFGTPTSLKDNVSGKLSTSVPINGGYYFAGWDIDGKTYAPGDSITLHRSVIANAIWQACTFSITYDANGGTITKNGVAECTYGQKYGELSEAKRAGYDFAGWYIGTTRIEQGQTANIARPLTLVAKWTPKNYEIVFYPNGATAGKMNNQTMVYDEKEKLFINQYTKKGYLFDGWCAQSDGVGTKYADQEEVENLAYEGTVALYATWKPISYNVKYYLVKGGTVYKTEKCQYDKSFTVSESGTKDYYTFECWNTKADGSGVNYRSGDTAINLTSTNGATVYMYAKWNPVELTYNFVVGDDNETELEPVECTYGETLTLPDLASNAYIEKAGHIFAGWRLGNEDSSLIEAGPFVINDSNINDYKDYIVDKQLTLTAVWAPESVTFSFVSNQFMTSTEMEDIVVKFGETIPELPVPEFEKYIFTGWETNEGEPVKSGDINKMTKALVYLKPRVEVKKYTVSYLADNKVIKKVVIEHSKILSTENMPSATKAGYLFKAWYVKKNGTKVTVTGNYKVTSDLVVYAEFSKVANPKNVKKLKVSFKDKKSKKKKSGSKKKVSKQLAVKFNKVNDADGYIVEFTVGKKTYVKVYKQLKNNFDKKFSSAPGNKKIKFDGTKNVTVKVTAFKKDSTNLKTSVKKLDIKKINVKSKTSNKTANKTGGNKKSKKKTGKKK